MCFCSGTSYGQALWKKRSSFIRSKIAKPKMSNTNILRVHVLSLHASRKCRNITGWPITDWGPDYVVAMFYGICRHAKSAEKILKKFVMVALNFIWLGLSSGEMDFKLVGVDINLLYCIDNATENKSSHARLKN